MNKLYFLAFLIAYISGNAQNVGIGTNTPAAKLDILGNIKITDGTQVAGRVLTTDANGLASWQSAGCFQNMVIFNTPGTPTWAVPAGVTKVFVEVWSGGGKGSFANLSPPQIVGGGGGSGAYGHVFIDVSGGGSISMSVGNSGSSGSPGYSALYYSTYALNLSNGIDGNTSSGYGAGGHVVSNTFPNAFAVPGRSGANNLIVNYTIGASTYTEYRGGNGGAAPFGGVEGSGEIYHSGYNSGATDGGFPGGGGGAKSTPLNSVATAGGVGCVIIHY